MATQQDLLCQLGRIGRSLKAVRTSLAAEPLSKQHIYALHDLDRAELRLLDAIDRVRRHMGVAPAAGRRVPQSSTGMIHCPHCGSPVMEKNLERHIRKIHQAAPSPVSSLRPGPSSIPVKPRDGSSASTRPPKALPPRPAPKRKASSPGVKLPGPTHWPTARREPELHPERLAESETLRKITLELELLNRDLYRDD